MKYGTLTDMIWSGSFTACQHYYYPPASLQLCSSEWLPQPTGGRRQSGHKYNHAFNTTKVAWKGNSRALKKSSEGAAGTASKTAGKAAEAAQTLATASQGAVQSTATAAQGAATATKIAATQAVKSAQKVCNAIIFA